jgi:hypothetical protein
MSLITPSEGWEIQPVMKSSVQCGAKDASYGSLCIACGTSEDPVGPMQPASLKAIPFKPLDVTPVQSVSAREDSTRPETSHGMSAGWVIFWLLFFPLWPISIPMLQRDCQALQQ